MYLGGTNGRRAFLAVIVTSLTGTMGYIAPEVMRRASGEKVRSAVLKKGDVYSFAVLMSYTLSGKNPFAGMRNPQIMVMILVDRKRPDIPSHVDVDPQNPVFTRMIQRLWDDDPLKRDGFPAIVKQLRELVSVPNVKQIVERAAEKSTQRQFVRRLPALLAGTKMDV